MGPQNHIRVVVVGGGISGLSAAWRIQNACQKSGTLLDLQLLEASPRLGGSLQSDVRGGFLLEKGPDCFISEKPRGIGLCRELGLENELIGTRPEFRRSYIFRNKIFHPVPEGFYLMGPSRYRPFLESGLLSWPGKFRAMLEPLMPSRPQSDESLASFVRRRFGQEMLDWMAQPLIAGIYGASPEDLSLRATFPQFLEMERKYGSIILGLKKRQGATRSASGARYSLFVTLRGGVQTLVDELAGRLGTAVVQTQRNVAGLTLTPTLSPGERATKAGEGRWQVKLANGDVLTADAVCLALPSSAAADLLRPLDDDLARELSGIHYAPAATLNFAFPESAIKRPLNGVGFVVPHKESRLVLGCTFAHHKFAGRAPQGSALVRAFLGGVQDVSWMQESDEALAARVSAELKNWLGITEKPLLTTVARYGQALPQYSLGHLQRILRIEERVLRFHGLSLAGNWQYGIGIPDCIQSGERAADQLIAYLRRPEPASL